MGYHKCPKCNGEGKYNSYPITTNMYTPCETCAGSGIISKLTGLPPFTPDQEADYLNSQLDNSGHYEIYNFPDKYLHKTLDITVR